MFMQFIQEKAESDKAFREEELKMRKKEEETKAAYTRIPQYRIKI